MIRVIHSSDWHLGHRLHGQDRGFEHRAFLDWLLDLLEQQQADALVLAGDLFDLAHPPAQALTDWYGFVARVRRRLPRLDLVVIAGNHDSAARIEAPRPLLAALGVSQVGRIPAAADGLESVLMPLHDAEGEVAAWCGAVPFLRTSDLRRAECPTDSWVEGHRAVLQKYCDCLDQRAESGQAQLVASHCHLVGGVLSEVSERRIHGGGQQALPVDVFPESLDYVALGHLHRAQRVGERDSVRYSGSPIPLSMAEADYRHQVLQVDFENGSLRQVHAHPVPRAVALKRIQCGVEDGIEKALAEIAQFAAASDEETSRWPFLEIQLQLDRPGSELQRKLRAACQDRAVRLVKVSVTVVGGDNSDLAPRPTMLEDWTPEQVFRERWRREFGSDPETEVLALFQDSLRAVQETE